MVYYLFILAVGAERLVELAVSRRNAAWSIAHGGKEFDRGHYLVMVGMHALLLVACILEVWALHRPFIPWLGWPMVAVVLLSTVVRWWCMAVLGKRCASLAVGFVGRAAPDANQYSRIRDSKNTS
jgi:methyltransferase